MFFNKNAGAVIDNSRASSSRIGAFIAKAKNGEETLRKINLAYSKLDALDTNGASMIRRDLRISNTDSI